jgi:hypothetical protein
MKRVSARTPRVAPAARPPEGQEADVGGKDDQGDLEAAGEVLRVVFKVELEADEETVRRIAIIRRVQARQAAADPLPGRWMGLIEAEEIACRYGAPLLEV